MAPSLAHLRLLVSIITGCLMQSVLTLHLCQRCTCVDNIFVPPYITASCQVSSPDFFSLFHNVTEFPSELYELELQSYIVFDRNHPLAIPVNAFASFANSSLCCLGFYRFYNLAPIKNGTFRGLKLQHVTFAGLGLDSLPMDALQEQSKSLLRVDVFDARTADSEAIVPPRFHSFEALQTITIESTPLKSLPNYTFCDLPSLLRVHISKAVLREGGFPRFVFHNVPRLESLQLRHDSFREMPSALSDLKTLKRLDLSHNEIRIIDARVLNNLPGLTELDLHGNQIELVGDMVVEALRSMTFLEVFSLGDDNPFLCTCELLPFIHWLHESSIHIGKRNNFAAFYCKTPSDLSGTPLLSPDLASYLESNCSEDVTTNPSASGNSTSENEGGDVTDLYSRYRIIIVPVVVVSVVLSLVGVAGTCMLHKKLKRRWVGLFRRFDANIYRQAQNPDVEIDYKYDAYVCHHESVSEFVVNEMIPEMEQEPDAFRLCLSFRDFLVGADKLENVTTALENSRVVIVLLDGNFIASGQCMLELNMACSRMLDVVTGAGRVAGEAHLPECGTSLLLVLLDALPVDAMPVTLRVLQDKITCLEWCTEDAERCWQQLKISIRDTRAHQTHQPDAFDI